MALSAPTAGAPVVVTGIYDAAYLSADPGAPGISTTTPAVFLELADLPSDPEEDDPVITVGAETFEVREVKKDSVGVGVLLLLSKVS